MLDALTKMFLQFPGYTIMMLVFQGLTLVVSVWLAIKLISAGDLSPKSDRQLED